MKKTYLVLFFIVFWSFSFSQELRKYEQIAEDLYFTKIYDSVFVIVHEFPWRCNSLLVLASNNKGVLIDTPNVTTGTESLLNWIQTEFGNIKLRKLGFYGGHLR